MNIESMRVRSYRSIAADEHVPEEAAERYRTDIEGVRESPRRGVQRRRRAGAGRDQPRDAVSVAWRRSRPVPAGSGSGPGSPGTSRR